jgi:predicted nuclease of predicted toxin-antitoxin system
LTWITSRRVNARVYTSADVESNTPPLTRISVDSGLPRADSVILAMARAHNATLWTQDSDFVGAEYVRYVEKK